MLHYINGNTFQNLKEIQYNFIFCSKCQENDAICKGENCGLVSWGCQFGIYFEHFYFKSYYHKESCVSFPCVFLKHTYIVYIIGTPFPHLPLPSTL